MSLHELRSISNVHTLWVCWSHAYVVCTFCILSLLTQFLCTQALIHFVQSSDYDPNAYNDLGDAPIHAIVRHKRKKRTDLLLTLLVHGASKVDVNKCTAVNHDCALHLAVMVWNFLLMQFLCRVMSCVFGWFSKQQCHCFAN